MKKKRILIISYEGIGDQVVRRPFMFAARETFRDDELVLVTPEHYHFIFQDIGFDKILNMEKPIQKRLLPKEHLKELILQNKELKKKFDFVFNLTMTDLMQDFDDVVKELDYNKLFFLKTKLRKAEGDFTPTVNPKERYIFQYFKLLDFFSVVEFKRPKLKILECPFSKENKEPNSKLINIGIFPYVNPNSTPPGKGWGTENFSKLMEYLAHHINCNLYIIGNRKEGGISFKYPKNKEINILLGETTIKDMFSLINKLDFIICNDSAPLHIADEIEKPVLAFYLPEPQRLYHPISRTSKIMISEPGNINSIKLADVIEKTNEIIIEVEHEKQNRK